MNFKNAISTKTALLVLSVLAVFLIYLKFQQYQSHKAIENEKQELMAQSENLYKKNEELSQSLSYLNSPGFKERIAREELNLKRSGEKVYTFSEKQAIPGELNLNDAGSSGNFQKWVNYFINPQDSEN